MTAHDHPGTLTDPTGRRCSDADALDQITAILADDTAGAPAHWSTSPPPCCPHGRLFVPEDRHRRPLTHVGQGRSPVG